MRLAGYNGAPPTILKVKWCPGFVLTRATQTKGTASPKEREKHNKLFVGWTYLFIFAPSILLLLRSQRGERRRMKDEQRIPATELSLFSRFAFKALRLLCDVLPRIFI